MKNHYKMAVFGSARGTDPNIEPLAHEVGKTIASLGHVTVTGACPGYPQNAIDGANELGGKTVGFSPYTNLADHIGPTTPGPFPGPDEGIGELNYVPESYQHSDNWKVCLQERNVRSTFYSDGGIIIGGSIGTLNEVTNLLQFGKPMGLLLGSGGTADKLFHDYCKGPQSQADKLNIVYDTDPVALVQKLDAFRGNNQ